MTSSPIRHKVLAAGIAAAFCLYPFAVYAGIQILPGAFIGVGLVVLLVARLVLRRQQGPIEIASWIAVLPLLGIVVVSPVHGVRLYPVVISLTLAAVFMVSLVWPPSAIERLARIAEPNLPAAGVVYTRRVTIVWAIFFFANAAIAAWTALWGTLELWTLYNGFLSYVAIGILVVGELAIRRFARPPT